MSQPITRTLRYDTKLSVGTCVLHALPKDVYHLVVDQGTGEDGIVNLKLTRDDLETLGLLIRTEETDRQGW